MTRLLDLVSQGSIDDQAPVSATGSIDVRTDAATAWDVLADVEGWSKIRSDVSDVELSAGFGPGARFAWKASGIPIESRFGLVERPAILTWANTAPGMSMACVYRFTVIGSSVTRLECAESLDAREVAPHLTSDVLAGSIRSWIEGIKRVAESR